MGFKSLSYELGADTSEAELLALVDQLNADPEVDGILRSCRRPNKSTAKPCSSAFCRIKMWTASHPYNVGRLVVKMPLMCPCTPKGVMTLLEAYGVNVEGKKAVVVGASNIVGRPQMLELPLARATVTICHSKTQNLAAEVAAADIVVAGVSIPNFVKGEWIKPGAVVIDVGINRAR